MRYEPQAEQDDLHELGRRSVWDPKIYYFHNGPLKDTDAPLEEVIDMGSTYSKKS